MKLVPPRAAWQASASAHDAILAILEPLPLEERRAVLVRVLSNIIIRGTNPKALRRSKNLRRVK